jgi:hypothetical protein
MNNRLLIDQQMMQCELDCVVTNGLARSRFAIALSACPMSRRSVLSGIQLSTYDITGLPREHGNLKLSADPVTASKPPSPAMSQLRGRVFVVVRARESRVHGEGRQSMSVAARSLG